MFVSFMLDGNVDLHLAGTLIRREFTMCSLLAAGVFFVSLMLL